ncbi:MAG TPA: Fic family protein [Candidatus Onthocola stercoravium]|nr:Fic family protein [Candidatus Onthocola stercoravium]
MKLNCKEMQYISKISNSLYDRIKVEFLYHSNHLEGSTFSKENLEKLITDNIVEGNHAIDDILETNNSLEVFDQVIKDSIEPLDKYMLFKWHKLLKRGTVDEEIHNTGMWKKYENRLKGVDLKLASPLEVDNLMYNLLMDWQETLDATIEDVANFHYKFERIHPFQDGNGRIGRFIILKQCLEKSIDLIAIDDEYKDEYKQALYKAQTTDDTTDLITVFKKCQIRLDEKMQDFKPMVEQIKKEQEF